MAESSSLQEIALEELVVRHIYAVDYEVSRSWQLMKWCLKQGADEWTLSQRPDRRDRSGLLPRFEEATAPYRLPPAERRQLTARTEHLFIRFTALWRLSAASLAVLQDFMPEGLFSSPRGRGSRLEDPIFYRKGEFMLGVVSHENEGIVRVTAREGDLLEAEGFVLRPSGTMVGY